MIDSSGQAAIPSAGWSQSARNVISGNELNGVEISGTTTANNAADDLVEDNYIGTNVSGTEGLPNGDKTTMTGDGVAIDGTALRYNTIGRARSLGRNVISGKISFRCGSRQRLRKAHLVPIWWKATTLAPTLGEETPVPNGADGARILSSSSNTIGGDMYSSARKRHRFQRWRRGSPSALYRERQRRR